MQSSPTHGSDVTGVVLGGWISNKPSALAGVGVNPKSSCTSPLNIYINDNDNDDTHSNAWLSHHRLYVYTREHILGITLKMSQPQVPFTHITSLKS